MSFIQVTRKAPLFGVFLGLMPLQAAMALNPPIDPEEPSPGGNPLPPVSRVDADGPYAVTIDTRAGPSCAGWVARSGQPATPGGVYLR